MTKIYYTPPSDECFEDLKKAAIAVWEKYDDTYGYASDKIKSFKDIGNVKDNFMFIFAMFDHINQIKVSRLVTVDTLAALRERLVDGGNPQAYIDMVLGEGEEPEDFDEVDDGGNDFGYDDVAQDSQ